MTRRVVGESVEADAPGVDVSMQVAHTAMSSSIERALAQAQIPTQPAILSSFPPSFPRQLQRLCFSNNETDLVPDADERISKFSRCCSLPLRTAESLAYPVVLVDPWVLSQFAWTNPSFVEHLSWLHF